MTIRSTISLTKTLIGAGALLGLATFGSTGALAHDAWIGGDGVSDRPFIAGIDDRAFEDRQVVASPAQDARDTAWLGGDGVSDRPFVAGMDDRSAGQGAAATASLAPKPGYRQNAPAYQGSAEQPFPPARN